MTTTCGINTPVLHSINVQVFTTSGTYTPTAGMKQCQIVCVGGGGAGGGGTVTGIGQHSAGSGGGYGEYSSGIFSSSTIGGSQTITIGAGGTGVSGAAGNNGGNSSVGSLISSFGGSGGPTIAATALATLAQGGAGGTGGSGGSVRSPGQNGFYSIALFAATINFPGPGGGGQLGSGGLIGNSANGGNGSGFGAGGGGVSNPQSSSALTGGNGTNGIVVITEYL